MIAPCTPGVASPRTPGVASRRIPSLLRPAAVWRALALGLLCLAAGAGGARAHVTELAVLRISETGNGRYAVVWEMKPETDFGSALEPIFPPHCAFQGGLLDCGARGLVGTLGFDAIGAGQSAALFKIHARNGGIRVITLTPSQPTVLLSPNYDSVSVAGIVEIFVSYVDIGFRHILEGVDHLLFVLGLMWISATGWGLVKTVTAFTVAHSITLAAVSLGWVGVPESVVNTMIALSIAFLGVEIVREARGQTSVTLRNPFVVAFLFGLLHGFGFADGLAALGLPDGAGLVALLGFNIGVEAGQLTFVAVALALAWSTRVLHLTLPERGALLPAYGLGGIAMFWFFDRTAVLFGV
ncbi:MAG: HupE/UreJ family protein [Pseudomonadota bacterium]